MTTIRSLSPCPIMGTTPIQPERTNESETLELEPKRDTVDSKEKAKRSQKGEQSPSSACTSSTSLEGFKYAWLVPMLTFADNHFAWVSRNLKWTQIKPVIRCALVAWISTVLFVIPAVEARMGTVRILFLLFVHRSI